MEFTFLKTKKIVYIIMFVFLIMNILLYSVEYKRYVSSAPIQLKEARKDIVNALMFHVYYTFFVKTVRIDFLNPILYPLKAPRDYFYHKGIDQLPIKEAERAIWFDTFEVRPYNFSVSAKYGSMARRYGQEFSKDFMNRLYENIRLLSLYQLGDKTTPDIHEEVLETYIDLIYLYTCDFHLHPDGFIFHTENMEKVSTDFELHQRFENIYKWEKNILSFYNKKYKGQYNRVLNPNIGWYSPYRNYHDTRLSISSFILFYKIKNDIFDCARDKKYLLSQKIEVGHLIKLLKGYPNKSKRVRETKRKVAYLFIPNKLDMKESHKKFKNALNLQVSCNYISKNVKDKNLSIQK